MILLPKPPPMSWLTNRSLSMPTRSAGAIQIAPTPGIWWFPWIVHCPVPRLNSTRQPEHSSGVDEKRSKWSRSIRTTWSASASAASKSPQSNMPDQTVFDPASSWSIDLVLERLLAVEDVRQWFVVDFDQLRSVTREISCSRDDGSHRVANVAHPPDCERVVLDVRAGWRRELEERVGQDRDLVAGQRPVDAVELERFRDVDGLDARMRVRRADEVDVTHLVPLDVVEEDALALDEPLVLLARDVLADEPGLRLALLDDERAARE